MIIARPALNVEYHFNLKYIDRLLHPGAKESKPNTTGKSSSTTAPGKALTPAAHSAIAKH
jgi:predicted transcriptional regulator